MHLNAFGADIAATWTSHSAPTFPRYADALRLCNTPPSTHTAPASITHTRRAARQAALQRAREARRSCGEATDASSTATSEGSWADDELVGVLRKRGRRTGLAMKRRFVLKEGVLYNFGGRRGGGVSWKLGLGGAVVGLDERGARIVVIVDGERRVVLYAEGGEEARRWAEALWRAADGFVSGGCEELRRDGRVLNEEGGECEIWDSFASFAKLEIRGGD